MCEECFEPCGIVETYVEGRGHLIDFEFMDAYLVFLMCLREWL